MEQNTNNRLLNEEELELVSGGSREAKELIRTFWFKCYFCGSNLIYTNYDLRCPIMFCGGCNRNIQECMENHSDIGFQERGV
jgi:hypothetical protein